MTVGQAQFIERGALARNSGFNVLSSTAVGCCVPRSSAALFTWLADPGTQGWPVFNKLEVSELPWHAVEEEIQRLRGVGMGDWIDHVWPVHSAPQPCPIRRPRTCSSH